MNENMDKNIFHLGVNRVVLGLGTSLIKDVCLFLSFSVGALRFISRELLGGYV